MHNRHNSIGGETAFHSTGGVTAHNNNNQSYGMGNINFGLDYEQFSERLIESIKMVRELLQSN